MKKASAWLKVIRMLNYLLNSVQILEGRQVPFEYRRREADNDYRPCACEDRKPLRAGVVLDEELIYQRADARRERIDLFAENGGHAARHHVTHHSAADARHHADEDREERILAEAAGGRAVDARHGEYGETYRVKDVDYLRIDVEVQLYPLAEEISYNEYRKRGGYGCHGVDRMPERRGREIAEQDIPDHSAADCRHRAEHHRAEDIEFFLDSRDNSRYRKCDGAYYLKYKKHFVYAHMYLLRSNFFLFSQLCKEIGQQRGAFLRHEARHKLGLVVIWQFKKVCHRPAGARLGVGGAVDHSAQP